MTPDFTRLDQITNEALKKAFGNDLEKGIMDDYGGIARRQKEIFGRGQPPTARGPSHGGPDLSSEEKEEEGENAWQMHDAWNDANSHMGNPHGVPVDNQKADDFMKEAGTQHHVYSAGNLHFFTPDGRDDKQGVVVSSKSGKIYSGGQHVGNARPGHIKEDVEQHVLRHQDDE